MVDKSQNLHQRLHAVMGVVKYVQKDKKQGMNYSVISHDVVTAKVRPVLVEHGIVYYPSAMAYTQDGNRTQVELRLRFVNVDDPDDYIDVPGLGFGIDSQDKGPGKAVSYAVKYCLLKTLGLETGDDPDMESNEHKKEPPRKASPEAENATSGPPQQPDIPEHMETAKRFSKALTAAYEKGIDVATFWKEEGQHIYKSCDSNDEKEIILAEKDYWKYETSK